jgi:hypothetical protein
MMKYLEPPAWRVGTSTLIVLTSFTSLYQYYGCYIYLVAIRQMPCDDVGAIQPHGGAFYVQLFCILFMSAMIHAIHMLCSGAELEHSPAPYRKGLRYKRATIVMWMVLGALFVLSALLIPQLHMLYSANGGIRAGSFVAMVSVVWVAYLLSTLHQQALYERRKD